MGLYERLLENLRQIPDAAKFPELVPQEAPARDPWDLPRLSDLPQTMLPPHMRKTAGAVDASAPAIQSAIGNAPAGPAIPPSLAMHAAGMIPLDQANSPFTTPEGRAMMSGVGVDAPTVPLPRERPIEAPPAVRPDDGAAPAPASMAPPQPTDVGARSRAAPPLQIAPPAAAVAPAAAPTPEAGMLGGLPSVLGRIRQTLGDNSNTLLAIGAGFAGAPNIGQAISRASAAAIPARAADIKQSLDAQSRAYGTKALVEAGVPIQQAIAAAGDPELKKALIQSYITDRKSEIKSVKSKDAFGNETERLYSINPYTNESKEITLGGDKSGGGTGGAAAGGKNATFAEGVTPETFDHTKIGDDYLAQFSPEVQSAAKAYLAGRGLPTGRQLSTQAIKMAAQKYGDDIGMPADDASVSQRKMWSNSLADVKSGVGLQAKGFQQGLEHFVKLSDALVKMNLSNGLGIEPIAKGVNWMKNLTTEQQELVHKAELEGQSLAGEMGNLFSKNGGGVHERAATKEAVSNALMSGKSAAGALQGVVELMDGGLKTLEQRRDELFPGGNAPKGSQFLGPAQQKALEHINNNIAILRGDKAAVQAQQAATAAPKPGRYVYDPATAKLVPAQ